MTPQTLTAVPMPLDALQNADLCAHRQLWHADAAAGAVQAYTLHHEGVQRTRGSAHQRGDRPGGGGLGAYADLV